MDTKLCTKCNLEKQQSEFWKDKNGPGGLTWHCKKCMQSTQAKRLERRPLLHVWNAMIRRCTKPSHKKYPAYGGRGITVCERWRDYDKYAEDIAKMGPRPTKLHSIDRIDNNGNYEPENVRWADPTTQSTNQRVSIRCKSGIPGVRQCGNRWGVMVSRLKRRAWLGVFDSIDEAVCAKRKWLSENSFII